MKKSSKLLCAIGLIAFFITAYLYLNEALGPLDNAVRSFAFSLRCEPLSAVLVPFTKSCGPVPCVVLCLALLAIPKTRFSYGVPMSSAAVFAQLFYQVLRRVFRRVRPDTAYFLVKEHGFSFPSGHSITSFMMYGFLLIVLIYYYRTKGASLPIYKKTAHPPLLWAKTPVGLGIWAAVIHLYVILMAFSRIYVGVHWPTDIVCAWSLGLFALPILSYIYGINKKQIKK